LVWDNDEKLPAAVFGFHWEGPEAQAKGECPLQLPRLVRGPLGSELVWRAAACATPAPYLCERAGWIIRERDRHAYRLSRLAHTWRAAQESCAQSGAHLATITDADEETFIEGTFPGKVWLGATDATKPGAFAWTTGEPLRYTKWAPREPDQSNGKATYCLALDVDGLWHDRHCEDGYPFVCEID
jgi:hypothetical protein